MYFQIEYMTALILKKNEIITNFTQKFHFYGKYI